MELQLCEQQKQHTRTASCELLDSGAVRDSNHNTDTNRIGSHAKTHTDKDRWHRVSNEEKFPYLPSPISFASLTLRSTRASLTHLDMKTGNDLWEYFLAGGSLGTQARNKTTSSAAATGAPKLGGAGRVASR